VQVAEQYGLAATPGQRKVGKMDPDAADADDADIDQSIESGERR